MVRSRGEFYYVDLVSYQITESEPIRTEKFLGKICSFDYVLEENLVGNRLDQRLLYLIQLFR